MSCDSPERSVTCVAWNHDGSNLAVGLKSGFIIYSTELLHVDGGTLFEVHSQSVDGGVGLVALHGQSNLVLVSGWEEEHRSTVAIYDLTAKEDDGSGDGVVVAQVTMPEVVNGLCLHPLLVIVGVRGNYAHVFNQKLKKVKDYRMQRSAVSSSGVTDIMVLGTTLDKEMAGGEYYLSLRGVLIGPTPGTVRCLRYTGKREGDAELQRPAAAEEKEGGFGPLEDTIVAPHNHEVQCIATTAEGRCAVTVSERGTMLKLLDVKKCVVIGQYSRGRTPNAVRSLAVYTCRDRVVLVCISDSGTLHVFGGPPLRRADESLETGDGAAGAKWSVPVVQQCHDYFSRTGSMFRFKIPRDWVADIQYGDPRGGTVVYSTAICIDSGSRSPTIFVAQRSATERGCSDKGRLLSYKVDMTSVGSSDAPATDPLSFYFPKSEL